MMTAIVQEVPQTINQPEIVVPPHVLIVGKKYATDYLAPALFRLASTNELLIRAKGSLSIVTAVNVAELVKRDVTDIVTKSISIGTEEMVVEGSSRRASYIEIHLAKKQQVTEAAKPKTRRKSTATRKRASKKTSE
jgi:DNA-binding protein Alba